MQNVIRHLWSVLVVGMLWLTVRPVMAADPTGPYLVRGKVTKVVEDKDNNGASTATVEVVHVYSGPEKLVGRTFNDYHQKTPYTDFYTPTPLQVDEEGLWIIGEEKGEWNVSRGLDLPFQYRYLKRGKQYDQMAAVAEAVEKVGKLKADDKLATLRELMAEAKPLIARWAALSVGRLDTPAAREFLDGMAAKPDTTLPIPALTALDAMLVEKKGADWLGCKPRLSLLRGWAAGKQSAADGVSILPRLGTQAEVPGADKLVLELYRTAAGNKEWAFDARRQAFTQLGRLADRTPNDDLRQEAFEWVFEQVQKADDVEVRRAAAGTVRYWFPLHPKRLKAVEEQLETEKDKEVADALRAAVTKAKESK